jgi:protein-tyrosine-phosphatase
MAEGIFRKLLEERDQPGKWIVKSAGTFDMHNTPASENSVKVMAEDGIDIHRHRSQLVNPDLLLESDLILTMAEEHLWLLEEIVPELKGRMFRLSEMAGDQADVEDPIGMHVNAYREAAGVIRGYLEDGYARIIQLAENPEPIKDSTG